MEKLLAAAKDREIALSPKEFLPDFGPAPSPERAA
jgi:hypothetical protein